MADGTVLIVGGTGGIGRELAAHYLDRGREVIITGRDSANAEVVASDLGDKAQSEAEFRRRANEVALILRAAGVNVAIESADDYSI